MPIPLGLILLGIGAGAAAAVLSDDDPPDYRTLPGWPNWRWSIYAHPTMWRSRQGPPVVLPIAPGVAKASIEFDGGEVDYLSWVGSGSDPTGDAARKIERKMWDGAIAETAHAMYQARAQDRGNPENVSQRGYVGNDIGGSSSDGYEIIVYKWGPGQYEAVLLGAPNFGEFVYLGRAEFSSLPAATTWAERVIREFAQSNWLNLSTDERLSLPPSKMPRG